MRAHAPGAGSPRGLAAWTSASGSLRAGAALLGIGLTSLLVVLLLARAVGVRGTLWFSDTPQVLYVFCWFVLRLAVVWDAGLCVVGAGHAALARLRGRPREHPWWQYWRSWGFFSIGVWPLPFILLTIYLLLGTSNVSHISLALLKSGVTTWHDAAYWSLEQPLFALLHRIPVNVVFWETIYNSGWLAEMFAFFVILVVTRRPAPAVALCVSFVLLFYLGRLVGLISPVMGPAFFVPAQFGYLDDSVTEWMMQRVSATMASGPETYDQGGVWLGGVAAMPSLHVGMVSLASYWLARAVPRLWPVVALWVLAVWTSTLLLGWHYAVDGLGGVALAAVCVGLTRVLLRALRVADPDPPGAAPAAAGPGEAPARG